MQMLKLLGQRTCWHRIHTGNSHWHHHHTRRVAAQNGSTTLRTVPHHRNNSTQAIPVDLSSDAYIPPGGNKTEGAVLILHGLFGSKRNFASLCKAFQRDLNRPIYALDLRNHGSSPHARPMTYESMAADVHHFITKNQLADVSVLGHSMGGKVAMTLALSSPVPTSLSNLIVSDIAPTRSSLSPAFVRYLKLMARIEDPASQVRTREEADKILQAEEKNTQVRQFLLTNLMLPPSGSGETAKFKIPVDILTEAIPALGSFPFTPEEGRQWHGRTLVVKAAKSDYIDDTTIPVFKAFFPNMRLEVLDTGHWVHADKPLEFKKIFVDFILGRRT
ncbi:alpha/beta-hydrolase [Lyophyllum atratum]|nr:alpha/beta-hydrolase [Lyophyllum atratum]